MWTGAIPERLDRGCTVSVGTVPHCAIISIHAELNLLHKGESLSIYTVCFHLHVVSCPDPPSGVRVLIKVGTGN